MSDFNIRDFRGAGEGPPEEKKADKTFGIAMVCIPVLAAIGGFAFTPIMEMRNGNAAALVAAQEQADLRQREAVLADIRDGKMPQNPFAAAQGAKAVLASLPVNPETGLINLNGPIGGGTARPKPKPLTTREFVLAEDAQAGGLTGDMLSLIKYQRTETALMMCDYDVLLKLYRTNNAPRYEAIKTPQITTSGNVENPELKKIKTKADAMKFVASGGVARHNSQSLAVFADLGRMTNSSSYKYRRHKFDQRACATMRTLVQSGALNI